MDYIDIIELIFEWKDIEDYEGLYKISEWGDVLSIGHGRKKLLKPFKTEKGYLAVSLWKNGQSKKYRVHRLVASAFCEGADYFPCVNHIDEDKTNNYYENLEWCTIEYNNNYGTHNQKVSKTLNEPT